MARCKALTSCRYPDVIESLSFKGPSQTIKTHHNVVSGKSQGVQDRNLCISREGFRRE